jgi:hypothetical protein
MDFSLTVRSLPVASILGAALTAQAVTATPVDTLLTVGPAAYDPGREQAVMLRQIVVEPSAPATPLCDLATWNGADWVPILPPIALPMRAAGLVHDPLRNRLLAFDGGQVLRFVDGQTVTVGPTVPSPVILASITGRTLVHDVARDELVVFGGYHEQFAWPAPVPFVHDETYVFRQGAWQLVPLPSRPAPRTGHAFAYDETRQRAVLFGGYGTGITTFGDTWEWDGTGWSQVATVGPPAGGATGMYDPTTQRVVVRDRIGDVWSFDGAAWTIVGGATTPRFGNSIPVHDGNSLLLVGGGTGVFPFRSLTETWRLVAGGWQRVPTSIHMETGNSAVMAYDSVRRELLCLHGNPMVSWLPGTTWTWNGAWRQHTGPAPLWGGMAFDEARGEAVLFGGTGRETWTWNGASWTLRAPTLSPPAEPAYVSARLAYDPQRQRVVLVGSGGTWLWDGANWSPAPGPQPPTGSMLVWDPVRAAVVMSGIQPTGETWEWNGQWQLVSASGGPQSVFVAAFDPSRGRTFAYEPGIEREWTGTAWLSRALPVPMRLEYARAMATDTDRGRVLFRGVVDPAQGIQLHVLGPTPSVVTDAGGGCVDGNMLVVEQRPAVGSSIEIVSSVDPAGVAIFGLSWLPAAYPVGACTLVVDGSVAVIWRFPSASGRVALPMTIAPTMSLRGLSFYVQAGTLRGSAVVLSRALRLQLGD